MQTAGERIYDRGFFDVQESGSRRSAAAMVPTIVDLLQPRSVLDVGCGTGTWLAEFIQAGVADCYGIDGPWVECERFTLGSQRLVHFDFASAAPPFRPRLPRDRFDLVTTFEFLEHVRGDHAPALVAFLARLGDTVVVSAAAPGQGGTDHVNENWIDYWADLFRVHGFEPFDFLRPLVWDDDAIEPWYRQNAVGFFRSPPPQRLVAAAEAAAIASLRNPRRLVHPGILENVTLRLKKEYSVSGLPRRLTKRLIGQRLTHLVKRTLPVLTEPG